MSDRRAILDVNLKKLLARAYVRTPVDGVFRSELKRRVLARAAETALSPPGPERTREWSGRARRAAALAAAAILLLSATLWWIARPESPRDARDPGALLAAGKVAVRTTQGGEFVAAAAAGGSLALDGFVEAITPADGAYRVELASDGSVELEGDSHVVLQAHSSGDVSLVATASGRVRFTRGAAPRGTWRIETANGAFSLTRGSARVIGLTSVVVDSAEPPPLSHDTGAAREAVTASQPAPDGAADAALRVHGRVIDASTHAPVPQFRVHLVPIEIEDSDGVLQPPFGRRSEVHAAAAADGRFSIDPPDAGSWRVFVEAAGLAIWHSELLRVRAGVALAPIDVAMRRGATLVGRVTDAASGEPVEGALVFSETDHPQLLAPLEAELLVGMLGAEPPRNTRTDARGEFRLAGLSPGMQRVRVVARGLLPAFLTVDGLVSDETRFLPDVALGTGGGVTGTVSRADGSPWARSVVMAMPQSDSADPATWSRPAGMSFTDETGRYRIENLPSAAYVVVHLGDRPKSGPHAALQVTPIVVRSSGMVVVDFRLPAAGVVLDGVLTDAAGRPMASQTLSFAMRNHVDDRGQSGWIGATTDATGTFHVGDLAAGTCDAYLVRGAGRDVMRIGSFELPAAGAARHDLRVAGGTIAGHVVDADTGAPITDATVVVERGDAGGGQETFEGKTVTGVDGTFELSPLPAGLHRVRVVFDRGDRIPAATEPIALADGAHVGELRIALFPGGRVRARVALADGAPLAGASIALEDAAGRSVPLAEPVHTGKNGYATLRALRPGAFTLIATAPGHPPARVAIDVVAGESREVTIEIR